MQQRRVRLGDILDDYCPRERRVTNHAVVAMIDDEVKQTRCTTCQSEHEYKGAKVPPARRRKAGALTGEETEGVIRPRPAGAPDVESEIPENVDETMPADETPDPFQETEPQPQTEPNAEAASDDGDTREQDEWPVHRPLIRATLPRPEGQTPERKAPDFTFRGGGRFDTQRNGKRHRGRGPRQGHGQGQGQGQGQGTRQGSGQRPRHGAGPGGGQPGQRHGNRPGQGGGRPGEGRGQRQGPGPGRKRGR